MTPLGDFSSEREGPRDECGVFGVYAPELDVSRLAYFALYALQHRGQESAGIATCEQRPHHDPARAGPGLAGVRRAQPPGAHRQHGDRPRALLDHRAQRLGELAAGLPPRPPAGRPGAQREPHQRGRAAQRAHRPGHPLPVHLGLGDHRRADRLPPRGADRGRGRRGDAAACRAPTRP